MNKELKTFYKRLLKEKNPSVVFSFYDGKVYITGEEKEINYPKGYSVIDGKVFHGENEIGTVIYKKNSDEIELNDNLYEELSVEKEEKSPKFRNFAYGVRRFFTKKQKEIDSNIDGNNESKIEVEKKENIFNRFGRQVKRACNFVVHSVANFFGYFGKRKEIKVPKDLIEKDMKSNTVKPVEKKEDKSSSKNKVEYLYKVDEYSDKENSITKDEQPNNNVYNTIYSKELGTIEKAIRAISDIINFNKDIDYSTFNASIEAAKEEYDKIYKNYANNISTKITDIIKVRNSVISLRNQMVKYTLEEQELKKVEVKTEKEELAKVINKTKPVETKEEIETEIIELPKVLDVVKPVETKEDISELIKSKISEYDKKEEHLKEIEEKIKYYEEFLSTHDLSHADDQGMKSRMEEKLNNLKDEYAVIKAYNDSHKTEIRDEKLAFYTKSSIGVDKEIANINNERLSRIQEMEKSGKTVINLGLAEERAIDAKKAELLRLKKECLERKAAIYKEYEVIGNKMYNAADYFTNKEEFEIRENNLNNSILMSLDSKKVKELKEIAKENRITGYSKMKKADLIDALEDLNGIKVEYINKGLKR